MIPFKKALKEIFESEMEPGGCLQDYCDEVLISSFQNMKSSSVGAICLGDHKATDSDTGDLQDRHRLIHLDVLCLSAIYNESKDLEEDAEERSYNMARRVRMIFKNANVRKLISASYSLGLAVDCVVTDEDTETLAFGESICRSNTIRVMIYLREDYGEYFSS
jgi:hypothetical protein